jgi:hypothetical protein
MDFSQLKANRSNNFKDLATAADKASGNQRAKKEEYEPDPRYWKLQRDDSDNGSAIIRFLPAPAGEDVPFVKYFTHGFFNMVSGQKRWYIERSRSSLNQPDPVAELNKQLWDSTDDNDGPARNQARRQKRSNRFVSNILVIKDPLHKENEGRVFLYEYGPSLFDMISDKMHPEFEEDVAYNPFDLWEGANFRLRIYKGSNNFLTYDKSFFDSPAPLHEDDAILENIWKKQYSLAEVADESNYTSYEDLKDKLEWVLNLKGETQAVTQQSAPAAESFQTAPPPAPKADVAWTPPAETPPEPPKETASASDDDDMDFFKNWEDSVKNDSSDFSDDKIPF